MAGRSRRKNAKKVEDFEVDRSISVAVTQEVEVQVESTTATATASLKSSGVPVGGGVHEESQPQGRIWTNSKSASERLTSSSLSSLAERNQEYRRKFLLALQFYCSNPSLILNSDLPADLVEFVSGQGFPIEALGVILEVKKNAVTTGSNNNKSSSSTSSSFSGSGLESSSSSKGQGQGFYQSNLVSGEGPRPKLNELSRRLVENWMSSDSCAEALVSLSLGDEIPGLIAETSNFHRLLFAIADCFNLSAEEFLKYLLDQFSLTVKTLVYGVRDKEYAAKIRSQSISILLDRVFLRFHSDSEHFFSSLSLSRQPNPFIRCVSDLDILCKQDFIARRIVTKILLGLSSHTATKFARTVFLVGHQESCAAKTLLYPSEEFVKNSRLWKVVLNYNIPLKSATKSKLFWSNWGYFIFNQSSDITEVWETCVKNWESLCVSSAVDNKILVPATYALVALGREIKARHGEKSAQVLLSSVKVFDNVAKCLDSTSEEKKACGMALAQVMGDLHTFSRPKGNGNPEEEKETRKLRFNSSNSVFHELVDYYENGFEYTEIENLTSSTAALKIAESPMKMKRPKPKVEVLDSDDEVEDDENHPRVITEEEIPKFELGDDDEDFEVDEKLLDYRRKKGKLPTYFSEIIEILIEGGGQNKDEYEVEALKKLCIMKIPFLLGGGVRIDANMAEVLVRCLVDYESDKTMEVPVVLALFEISSLHPQETFDIMSKIAFDAERYTYGQRMIVLRRLSEIVQHHCKTMCLACYTNIVAKKRKELLSFCADFVKNYFDTKRKLRYCSNCATAKRSLPEPLVQNSDSTEISIPVEQRQEDSNDDDETPTWRQIVDRRVKAKTRYFFTSKRQTAVLIPDEYSSRLVLIICVSIANKLSSKSSFFMNVEERRIRGSPHDMLLAQMFRLLGRIIMGLQGPICPHLGSIATQVGDLFKTFILHQDASVRLAVLALLAITVSVSDGASYVIEAISSGQNIFETLKVLRDRENSPENVALIDHTLAFIAQATTMDYRLQYSNLAGNNSDVNVHVPSPLRILPDIL